MPWLNFQITLPEWLRILIGIKAGMFLETDPDWLKKPYFALRFGTFCKISIWKYLETKHNTSPFPQHYLRPLLLNSCLEPLCDSKCHFMKKFPPTSFHGSHCTHNIFSKCQGCPLPPPSIQKYISDLPTGLSFTWVAAVEFLLCHWCVGFFAAWFRWSGNKSGCPRFTVLTRQVRLIAMLKNKLGCRYW